MKRLLNKHFNNSLSTQTHFIAFVITTWHFDNLMSYIIRNKLKGGILVVRPQSNITNNSKYRITKEYISSFNYEFASIIFIENLPKREILTTLKYLFSKKTGTVMLIVPSMRPSITIISMVLFLKKNIIYISIDEGMSSYLSYKNLMLSQSGKKNILLIILKNIIYKTFSSLFIRITCKSLIDHRLFIHDAKKKILSVNPNVANLLEVIYRGRTHSYDKVKNIIVFKDFGFLSEENDISIYHSLLFELNKIGIKIYLKKHPNDVSDSFDLALSDLKNIEIINKSLSGEDIITKYNPICIVGGYSTVLFSSSNIFKIKAISFMDIYLFLDNIKTVYKNNIDHFRYLFRKNEYIKFTSDLTSTISEIENTISISQKNE